MSEWIAIIEHTQNSDCNECGNHVIESLTEWVEVTTEEFELLQSYCIRRRLFMFKRWSHQKVKLTIPLAIEEQKKFEAEAAEKRRRREEKRRLTEKKKTKQQQEAERKLFEELKKKYDSNSPA